METIISQTKDSLTIQVKNENHTKEELDVELDNIACAINEAVEKAVDKYVEEKNN